MKTIYSFLLTALILFVFSPSLKGQQQEFCEGETASFKLNGYKGGEIVWQKSPDQNNWEDISDTNDEIFEVTVTDSLYYRAKVSEGTCKPYYSDTSEIIMLPQPTTADGGVNITDACVPVTLNGNTPLNGTGEWTVVSGSGGSFDDPTNPTADFSGNPSETYTLEWAIGTQCDTITDQVEVNFREAPTTADAGIDTSGACTPLTLYANTPSTGTGEWTIISGSGGSFDDPTSPTANFSGNQGNTYTLEWAIGNQCDTTTDQVEVSFVSRPTTADAGVNITDACVPVTLNGNTPSNGTGEWTVVSGSGGNFDDPTSASASFSGNSGNTYTLEWAIGNQCDTTTDQVEVSFMPEISVDFSSDKTTISVGDPVNFTDESTGNPTSWSWDFGDGNTSTEVNPSHTYSSEGTYTVELTVSNDCGENTETKTGYISVGSAPTADFSADQTEIQLENSVQFTDESTESPTSWSWDFGDGNTSSEENPSHTYSSEGTYTVELTVSNEYGADTKTKTDYITVSNLTACDWNNDTIFSDSRDGQEYKQTKIGDQCWMAENLNYDQDSYGDDWCHENNSSNCDTYGRLYDWYAVMQGASSSSSNPSGVQGVCPDGWHVPSDEEWTELVNYVGNDGHSGSEGKALKSKSGWNDNGNGTDNYGFTALPGGGRFGDNDFRAIGYFGYWWSSKSTWCRGLDYDNAVVNRAYSSKPYGFSVRCVRD